MKTLAHLALKSFFELLENSVTIDGYTFPVYRGSADPAQESHYIMLRTEGSTAIPNSHGFRQQIIVITEVVTVHNGQINDDLAPEADSLIGQLMYQDGQPSQHQLPQQEGMQIVNVERQDATYLPEYNSAKKVLTLAARNVLTVEQL
jgi:hypothetical protein